MTETAAPQQREVYYQGFVQGVGFRYTARRIAARFGVTGALRLAALCHLGMVLLLFALPLVYDGFGWIYYAGVAAIAGLLIYEHALVRPDNLTRVNRAFFHVNAVVSIGLFVVGSLDLLI